VLDLEPLPPPSPVEKRLLVGGWILTTLSVIVPALALGVLPVGYALIQRDRFEQGILMIGLASVIFMVRLWWWAEHGFE
jgi:hypothetical protein